MRNVGLFASDLPAGAVQEYRTLVLHRMIIRRWSRHRREPAATPLRPWDMRGLCPASPAVKATYIITTPIQWKGALCKNNKWQTSITRNSDITLYSLNTLICIIKLKITLIYHTHSLFSWNLKWILKKIDSFFLFFVIFAITFTIMISSTWTYSSTGTFSTLTISWNVLTIRYCNLKILLIRLLIFYLHKCEIIGSTQKFGKCQSDMSSTFESRVGR